MTEFIQKILELVMNILGVAKEGEAQGIIGMLLKAFQPKEEGATE